MTKEDTEPDTMDNIEFILHERNKTHGNFEDNADAAQRLKYTIRDKGEHLHAPYKEALEAIACKMARILSGGQDHIDNWFDIEGYARLARNYCRKQEQKND